MAYLPSKDTVTITSTVSHFSNFELKRLTLLSSLPFPNIFAVTSLIKNDVILTFEMASEVFSDFQKLSIKDRTSLVNSFVLKLRQIQPALDHVGKRAEFRRKGEEELRIMISGFFGGSFVEGEEMEEKEIWRIFGPLWIHFFERVIEPIIALNLDEIELMAIIWILFFDQAYTNITQKTVDLCWNIRKVVFRELRNYLMEKTENWEKRFMEILEIPMIVERAEQKFMEEFLICEMNRIRVHDDFREIIRMHRT
uniref:NR LBD domain-containing protein n=1 Tax=Caenorhabditis tropicalis TaxID=1561998 RepID=A0A1I7TUE5_9PELO